MRPSSRLLDRTSLRALAGTVLVGFPLAACASGGGDREPGAAAPREYAMTVEYRVSCSVSNECRVTYLDQEGALRARDIVGEWSLDLGADPGRRVWLRVGAGGCPPRPVRVEIAVDGRKVAEELARAEDARRCAWILAETEFTIP